MTHFLGLRARRAHIRKHVGPALNVVRMSKSPPGQIVCVTIVKARVLILADHPVRNVMPSMHRRPRRIPRDMHHDAREIVLAPVLLWCQDLREPNATPVVALVLPVQAEEGPLHGDEEHRRQPIPERVLGRIATASILTCPLCLAEMRIFRTRFFSEVLEYRIC